MDRTWGGRDDWTIPVVLTLVAVGLVARVVFLGTRISHFDEARVAWWGLHYLDTGVVQYRFIIHGPFLQYVHRPLFALFGPTDFVARLPVALIGGLLPLVALWFRRHLSNVEVVGLALFLAFDPILLYYSRFMRSTMLVATFCFVAFAAFVRWYDGLGHRYLYVGTALLALGFTAKENAFIYVLCWVGAGVLLVDTALFDPSGHDSGVTRVTNRFGRWRDAYHSDPGVYRRRLLGYGVHLAAAAALFALVILYFYAPRGGDAGLWSGNLGATVTRMAGHVGDGIEYWFGHGGEKTFETYREKLGLFIGTTLWYSGPLFVLSVVGFAIERYARPEPRPLVLGCAYWGFASVVGYPLGADIWGAWIIVNAIVPLAVPAAVGLGSLVTVGQEAIADTDYPSAATVVVLLLLVTGQTAAVGVSNVYLEPTGPDNDLVQYAQPQQEMRPAVDEALAVAAANEEAPDVLFYGGEEFVTMDETAPRTPACIAWFNTLPWAWYLDANDASVTCAQTGEQIPESMPPVVVAEADCSLARAVDCRTQPEALVVNDTLVERIPETYSRSGFLHRTTGGGDFHGMVVYTDTDRGSFED